MTYRDVSIKIEDEEAFHRPSAAAESGSIPIPSNERIDAAKFEERLRQLTEFKETHGHLGVSREREKELADFLRNSKHKLGRKLVEAGRGGGLSDVDLYRIRCLENLGVEWASQEAAEEAKAVVREYQKQQKRGEKKTNRETNTQHATQRPSADDQCTVTRRSRDQHEDPTGPRPPAASRATPESSVSPARTSIGWDIMFGMLRAFKQKHGHINVKRGENGENYLLATWLQQQRAEWAQVLSGARGPSDSMTKQGVSLDSIGFFGSSENGGPAAQQTPPTSAVSTSLAASNGTNFPQTGAGGSPQGHLSNSLLKQDPEERKEVIKACRQHDTSENNEQNGDGGNNLVTHPPGAGHPPSEFAHLPKGDAELVEIGTRVGVYWHSEKLYFEGTIEQERPCKKKQEWFVRYDDGETEWVDLSKERFCILPSSSNNLVTLPPGAGRPPSEFAHLPKGDAELVEIGTRVGVYWRSEKLYFEGTVEQERPCKKNREWFVRYDDGDTEWVDLSKERFCILPSPNSSSNGNGSEAPKRREGVAPTSACVDEIDIRRSISSNPEAVEEPKARPARAITSVETSHLRKGPPRNEQQSASIPGRSTSELHVVRDDNLRTPITRSWLHPQGGTINTKCRFFPRCDNGRRCRFRHEQTTPLQPQSFCSTFVRLLHGRDRNGNIWWTAGYVDGNEYRWASHGGIVGNDMVYFYRSEGDARAGIFNTVTGRVGPPMPRGGTMRESVCWERNSGELKSSRMEDERYNVDRRVSLEPDLPTLSSSWLTEKHERHYWLCRYFRGAGGCPNRPCSFAHVFKTSQLPDPSLPWIESCVILRSCYNNAGRMFFTTGYEYRNSFVYAAGGNGTQCQNTGIFYYTSEAGAFQAIRKTITEGARDDPRESLPLITGEKRKTSCVEAGDSHRELKSARVEVDSKRNLYPTPLVSTDSTDLL